MLECWDEDPNNRPTFKRLHETITEFLQVEVNEVTILIPRPFLFAIIIIIIIIIIGFQWLMRMSPYSLCKCPRWRELNTAAEPRILTKTPHGYTQGNIMGNSRIAPLIYIRIHTSNIRINASNKRVVRS